MIFFSISLSLPPNLIYPTAHCIRIQIDYIALQIILLVIYFLNEVFCCTEVAASPSTLELVRFHFS